MIIYKPFAAISLITNRQCSFKTRLQYVKNPVLFSFQIYLEPDFVNIFLKTKFGYSFDGFQRTRSIILFEK
jgi:hypothetical protein